MESQEKTDLREHEWLRRLGEIHSEVLLPGYWSTLASNCESWANEISAAPFWGEVSKRLDSWRGEYSANTGTNLLARPGLPSFIAKSESSICNKLFRKCKQDPNYFAKAIRNENPKIPRLGDMVRTRIACRYIDGVEFLASKLVGLGTDFGHAPLRTREGRIEGYFAQHVTIEQEVIYRFGGAKSLTKIRCEIQIATELSTRMWEAAHPLYDLIRGEESDPEDWQWKPDDARFLCNQLGHMIHLADGLLVQLRKNINLRRTSP